jgi:hypothetical protein
MAGYQLAFVNADAAATDICPQCTRDHTSPVPLPIPYNVTRPVHHSASEAPYRYIHCSRPPPHHYTGHPELVSDRQQERTREHISYHSNQPVRSSQRLPSTPVECNILFLRTQRLDRKILYCRAMGESTYRILLDAKPYPVGRLVCIRTRP